MPGLRSVFRCCVRTCCSVAPTAPTASTIELLTVEERSLTSRVLWDMLFGRTFPQGLGHAAFAHRSCLHMCCTATMPHPTERYVQTVSFGEHEVFYCICASSSDDNSNRPFACKPSAPPVPAPCLIHSSQALDCPSARLSHCATNTCVCAEDAQSSSCFSIFHGKMDAVLFLDLSFADNR